jgi:hypothetical protein
MITGTKAIVTLVDMVIFSSCRKHIAFADWMGQRGDYSRAALEQDFAWSASVRFGAAETDRFISIWIARCGMGSAIWIARCGMGSGSLEQECRLSATHCVLGIQPTEKMAGSLAGHLPM